MCLLTAKEQEGVKKTSGRGVQISDWTPLPPPLSPPSGAPTQTKRVHSAPFPNRHPFAYSPQPKIDLLQSYGAETETRTLLHTWPAKHLQVALNTHRLLSFLQHSIVHLLILSCKFGVISCSFGFTHPVAHTNARVALTCRCAHCSVVAKMVNWMNER